MDQVTGGFRGSLRAPAPPVLAQLAGTSRLSAMDKRRTRRTTGVCEMCETTQEIAVHDVPGEEAFNVCAACWSVCVEVIAPLAVDLGLADRGPIFDAVARPVADHTAWEERWRHHPYGDVGTSLPGVIRG